MRMVRTIVLGGALLALAATFGPAGETTTPDWVAKLPANKWTLIDEKQSGNRIGARVVWLEKEKKLVISGGLNRDSHREPKRPNAMIFDPATGKWDEYKGEPALPPPGPRLELLDAKAKNWRISVPLPEAMKGLAGQRRPRNSPFGEVSPIFGYAPVSGAEVFLDPVNREVHLVGGSSGGVEGGSIGNWIYSIEKDEWRKAEFGKPEARALQAQLLKAAALQKDAVAAARNVYYATLPAAEESAAVKDRLAPVQEAAVKATSDASARLEKEGAGAGVAPASLKVALGLAGEAAALAKKAGEGLASGRLEPALIAAADDACRRLDEAADAIASQPGPRRDASGCFDPSRNLYVLHGGDHGDYMYGDTWIYDCAARSWRRIWPETSPGHRTGAQAFWLPEAKRIALLAGSTYLNRMVYQRFSQPLPPEVWSFDPGSGRWDLLVVPGEEIKKLSSDRALIFMVNNPVVLVDGGVLLCPAVGGNSYHDYMVSSTWMLRLDPAAVDPALTAKAGVAGSGRLYRSQRVDAYDPQWYDSAPRGDPKVIDELIAQMPANQWVAMPPAPRPCPERSWGTSHYDTKRDQIYVWSGGHCADPSDLVHTFHPGINRWSLPYVAGGGIKGNQLTGRPDCNNHTYTSFAFDMVSKKMVALHAAGTHVYDPDRREWTGFTKDQPFRYNLYGVKCVGTPRGVVAWTGGCSDGGDPGRYFGVFDAGKLSWSAIPLKGGALPPNVHGDEGGMTWDSKRKVLYIFAARGYQKPDGRVHKVDLEAGTLEVLDPKNRDSIGDRYYKYRETTYLPDVDLVLFGMGFVNGRQIAYDPAGNRWVYTSIPHSSRAASYDPAAGKWTFAAPKADDKVGSITFSPALDTRRNVLWAPSDYKAMYVMKLDPKTLEVLDSPPEGK